MAVLLFFLLLFALPVVAQDFWTPVTLPVTGASVNKIKVDSDGRIILNLSTDIYYSTDNGASWTKSSNWGGYSARCIGFDSLHNVYVGTPFNGIFRSTNGGATFQPVNNGLGTTSIWSFVWMPADVFLIGTDEGLYISGNYGEQWISWGTGLPQGPVYSLSAGTGGCLFAAAGTDSVFRSTDQGVTWNVCMNGLPAGNVLMSLCAAQHDNKVFVALSPDGMYRSPNDGLDWYLFNSGLPPTDNPEFGSKSLSWVDMFGFCLLAAAYGKGVYRANINDPDGIMFDSLGPGLPQNPRVTVLAVSPQGRVYAGCQDQGLYAGNLPTAIPAHPPGNDGACTVMVCPNPFGDKTTFTLNVPSGQQVRLAIYNSLGQEIGTVLEGNVNPGIHRIEWRSEGIEAGYYFYNIRAGDEIITGKIVKW